MSGETESDVAYRPVILAEVDAGGRQRLCELRADPGIECIDLRPAIRREFDELPERPFPPEAPEQDRWVYFPWRGTLVALPGERTFRAVRLDRNRNKLTRAEQDRLGELTVGVVGQGVGHAVAYTLALEGICGRLRLADGDRIALSNLNRIPATIFDIGVNKAVVTARRIAEIDPFLPVEIVDGVGEDTLDAFLDGLSIVIEECDSFDMKLAIREAARRHGLPLIMETSDRGLLDIERYDLEPSRLPFHGLLGDVDTARLAGLTAREKTPHVLRILEPGALSARMLASMVELGESVASWPQLGSEVLLGGASVAAAVRRFGLGQKLLSGRVRVDLEQALDLLAEPTPQQPSAWDEVADERPEPGGAVSAVLACAGRAPSGGNAQPWVLRSNREGISIDLMPERSSAMDIGYRASAVAVGAALYNARTAAAALGLLGECRLSERGPAPLSAIMYLGDGSDPDLAADHPMALRRETNRHKGTGDPIPESVIADLRAAARAEGAALCMVTQPDGLGEVADVLAASDRVRYLTPALHREMIAELRGPDDDLRTGLDLRSLELSADESAALEVARRTDVMAELRAGDAGRPLGSYIRERVRSSSAVVAVTFSARCVELSDYARAGAAAERVWLAAQRHGLAVQPISPVFLYARRPSELIAISPAFTDTLTSLQRRFLNLLGVSEQEAVALVLRMSYAPDVTVGSRRLPVPDMDTCG
ncbi:Rv1355c family protein [Nocardia sp. NPDC051570]|uniref:Rv1355c family protein n=1 Tax=Nocardia sp. NPDC051570 TaxID=3364324 RepID=UPI0037A125D7